MIRTEHREEKWPFAFVKYEPEKKITNPPIIIQLHGAGERGDGKDDLSLVDVHGLSKIMGGEDLPAIFIMPQCPKDSFWAARVESIIRFIEMLIEEYGIDKNRVYLTGLSMGGFGTWFTAMARPDLFAAIAPVCGGGMPWNAGVLTMPIWAFHGALDKTVLPEESEKMVNAVNKRGGSARLTIYPENAHDAWSDTFSNPEVYEWLLSHKNENAKELINEYSNNVKDFG